ncbi:hypothetical protein ACM46_17745 [Chryseobacterium angstadtii]|uniref:Uncharacterized protein n=1 Tax=Chryseobacterium angstadtii TaxID=558151 RepID=A0A0J7I1G7_9FLAO|nr:hypothetical protein [Chryseobacterium angstadtii]KMQ60087.1 hypothetical protein ACM46_17745 [Chryseobacterium angstadtii]
MKNLVILLSFISIFSCKKAQENVSKPPFPQETSIDKNWSGDVLISDLNFVSSINSTCKLNTTFFNRSEKQVEHDDAKCVLSKIKFDYDKLNSINKKNIIGKLNSNTELFIKNSVDKNNNADLSYQTTLYIEKNKTITDSIVIYQSFNYSEALIVKTKYYYLDKNEIYLLDVTEDESGANVEKWEHYKINFSGSVSLIKQNFFLKDNNVTKTNIDLWKGVYHFEASNRDEAKTIFDIMINSLEDISLAVTEEGKKNNYSKLHAEEVNNGKIKINYDSSSGDMGTIYIERSDNNYFISGNPIYFINPGTDEMPLHKLK